MTTNVSLKTPKEENSVVWLTLSDGRDVCLKIYAGITVKCRHWSKKNACVLSANPDAAAINAYLKDFQRQVADIYLAAKGAGVRPDAKYMRRHLEAMRRPQEPEPEKPAFWRLWEGYLASNRNRFKERSFLKFAALERHLKAFEKHRKSEMDLEKLNGQVLESLQGFFYQKKDLNTQTTAKYLEILKMFLKWCVEGGHTQNADWRRFRPIQQKDTLKVILTADELQRIRRTDLKGKNYLSNVRELLILSCHTGLRHSDYSRIRAEHFKIDGEGTPTLLIRQDKTSDYVHLPLTPEAEAAVRKIISGELHNITNQRMNLYLKELCQLSGIDEPFEVHTFKGKTITVCTKPKWQLVCTHTARRTFATTLLLKNVPAQTVMLFTGHRDYKSFAKYVNIPKAAQMQAVKNALLN